jgi:UDP-N-acetylmuramate dehydrogenase
VRSIIAMLLLEHVPMAALTTLGVGGPARYFCEAHKEQNIRDAVVFARERDLPLFIMGGGSNLVVADGGFSGLVLKVALLGIKERSTGKGQARFSVAAGESWDALVAGTVQSRFAGLECLSGIPGTVGGTPVQNVGAYGQEVSETIVEVQAIDLERLESLRFSNAECQFSYRSSRFNTSDRGRYVITGVDFCLEHGKPALRYPDIQNYFAESSTEPTLAEVREAVLQIRGRKAMVIVPGDKDSRSAGSFFKNPVLPEKQHAELAERLSATGMQLPSYPAGDGLRKLPAAWLVEHAGFFKGYAKGAAGISTRHSLAIVNRGGATAADIVALKDEIQQRVKDEFGIELQTEPMFVGF